MPESKQATQTEIAEPEIRHRFAKLIGAAVCAATGVALFVEAAHQPVGTASASVLGGAGVVALLGGGVFVHSALENRE